VKAGLPVDVDRLKAEFPDLTDDDLAAYVAVTRRVLSDPAGRARAMRDVIDRARAARLAQASGATLGKDEQLLARYLAAMDKMQRSTVKKVQ
jgi:hypothetical protein